MAVQTASRSSCVIRVHTSENWEEKSSVGFVVEGVEGAAGLTVEGVERTNSSPNATAEGVESIVSTSLGFVAGLDEGGVEGMISFAAGFVAPCRARFR